ncbi:tyrosine-type recombinase/integrase [Tellurirhabdus bombi]|uniref:tyrosine-type recombinase/integrase n=1 Tax=Tellurirhabdus bombi TaxID=2907205 RepID=UPI001F3BEFA3|nr:site-specific integrase [Tellurirhabdus bombi]
MGQSQNFSKKLIIRSEYVKKDGTCPLYIYVSIDGEWERLPLKLNWPAQFFDKAAGAILPRMKNDNDYSDYKLMIDTEIGKINEIFKTYRLSSSILTLPILKQEYAEFNNRESFTSWWERDLKERYKRKKIEYATYKTHKSALAKFKEFKDPVLFRDLTPKLLENYKAWLKTNKDNIPTTVNSALRRIRTYVYRALDDGKKFANPFPRVKIASDESMPEALTDDQLMGLLAIYNDKSTPDNWKMVLTHFLFSCFTGLRIGDARTVTHENIKGEWLILMPKKTKRYHKVVRIPLHPMALTLVKTSLGKLFDTYSEQYTNRLLKKVTKYASIDFKVTTHTARHTFGTLFIELGGDVVTLKDYMGHSKIETTMKYVHLSEKRKKEKIRVFDKLFQKPDDAQDVA